VGSRWLGEGASLIPGIRALIISTK